MSDDQKYFALKSSEDLAESLVDRAKSWRLHMTQSGIQEKWDKAYQFYYGRHFKGGTKQWGSDIVRMGLKGELTGFAVNHFRNLVRHTLAMTCSQKPAFDARATNSDLKSLQQARLANNILESYLREKRLGRYLHSAAEMALVFGKGFIEITWEPSLGRPYGKKTVTGADGSPVVDESGQPQEKIVYEGDVDVRCAYPWEVFGDDFQPDWRKSKWIHVGQPMNRHDLIARHPAMADKILAIPSIAESEWGSWSKQFPYGAGELNDSMVMAGKFYHLRTEAVPNGRYMFYLGSDCVLYDDAIPYQKLPVFRIVPGEIMGTTEGYADAFDLIGVQEAYNTIISSVFTNQQALGVQAIYVPEGCNISKEQLGKGLAIIKGPAGLEPKALQLTSTPPELFKFLELMKSEMELISGINSVVRGDPEHSLRSGTALSLVQSMAVQYTSAFQQSWAELLEDTGTFLLDLIKSFCKTERLVAMSGKHNRSAMQAFTGADLENVDRVVVDLGNPVARTTAGRLDMANSLLDSGKIDTPQEYIQVVATGNLEPMLEGKQARVDRIRAENEALMDGRPVRAMVGDSHLLDMQEHQVVMNDPLVRDKAAQGDPMAMQVVQNAMMHIQEHMQLYQTQGPVWSMIAGEPPAPQMGAPGMPPGPGGPPPGPGAGPLPGSGQAAPPKSGPPSPGPAMPPMPPGPGGP